MSRPEDSPWAIPVAQVGARAGQSKQIDLDLPAPTGIGDQIVGIRAGVPVHLTGSFESLVDGLIFMAQIRAPLQAECARCLKTIQDDMEVSATAFFPFKTPEPEPLTGKTEIIVGEDEEEGGDIYPLSRGGAFADLESLLRDNLAESLPLQPLCKPDCRGLCPQCGLNLNDHPDHHHQVIDDRWDILKELRNQMEKNPKEG